MLINKILKFGGYETEFENRTKISTMTSSIGLLFNVFLAIVKVVIFLVSGSVSILADAINNVTDSISSVITIIGVKVSSKPADRDHPYGHGRIEYIAALVVACFVLVTGFEFVKLSYNRIVNPVAVNYSKMAMALMVFSTGIKLYMSIMYKKIGSKIDSSPMEAQYKDSIADVIITSVVLVSIIFYKITNILIDGYIGFLVSLFIIYSGYELIRDTISELIGEAPDETFVKNIEKIILSYEKVQGIHDIIINSYGPENTYVSLDVEVPYDMSLVEAHELIDDAERRIKEELKCNISIHVDPYGGYDEELTKLYERLSFIVKSKKELLSFHDLRKENNIIRVQIVVDGNLVKSIKDVNILKTEIEKELVEFDDYNSEIEMYRSFNVEEE